MNIDFNEQYEQEILNFIQKNYGMEVFTPGLERTKPIFFPFIELVKKKNIKITIIAGTNGKGQSAHTLAYFLEAAKLSTGLWTSPHILSLRERFRFNGRDIGYEELKSEIYCTHEFLQINHSKLVVSFYEFLFLVFLRLAFNNQNGIALDHLILEVGLGGRLDAVNHFEADCTCITSISRDHQVILGSRYDQILREKIAVSRPGKTLFTQFKLKYLNQITEKYCHENNVIWKPISLSNCSSAGYFEENQKMAQEIFRFLEPNKINLEMSGDIPFFKGRREEMTFRGNTLIFIGAHNIDGIRRMIEFFSTQKPSIMPSKVLLSFSARPTDELEVMLKTMVEYFGGELKLYLTSFNHPKALELSEIIKLEKKFHKINKGLLDFVIDWKSDLIHSKNQNILVCGSYYFVGEVQRFILSHS